MIPVLVSKVLSTELNSFNRILENREKVYTFLNPVSYLTALDNKQLFSQYDGIFADGSLLVAAIKMLYGKKVTRRSFDMTSFARELFGYAEKEGKSIYIVASRQEEVEHAVEIFQERYPLLRIVGYRNGYFANEAEKDVEARHIVETAPDMLVVGMGIVMQEEFLLKVKRAGFKGVGFTCGGFVHQTAKGEADYYPAWVDRMNLRFLYRIYKEPHTRKRYAQAALLFPVRFILERLFG